MEHEGALPRLCGRLEKMWQIFRANKLQVPPTLLHLRLQEISTKLLDAGIAIFKRFSLVLAHWQFDAWPQVQISISKDRGSNADGTAWQHSLMSVKRFQFREFEASLPAASPFVDMQACASIE